MLRHFRQWFSSLDGWLSRRFPAEPAESRYPVSRYSPIDPKGSEAISIGWVPDSQRFVFTTSANDPGVGKVASPKRTAAKRKARRRMPPAKKARGK